MPIVNSLLLFGIGATLVLYAIWCWRKILVARQLPTINVEILKTEIIEIHELTDGVDLIKYQPKITFSGRLSEMEILAQKLCPDDEAYKFSNREHAEAFTKNYPVGLLTLAKIENLKPAALVLTSEVNRHRKSHYLAIAAGGVIIWAVMGMLIWITSF